MAKDNTEPEVRALAVERSLAHKLGAHLARVHDAVLLGEPPRDHARTLDEVALALVEQRHGLGRRARRHATTIGSTTRVKFARKSTP